MRKVMGGGGVRRGIFFIYVSGAVIFFLYFVPPPPISFLMVRPLVNALLLLYNSYFQQLSDHLLIF